MAVQGYQAVSFFPAQVSDVDYYHGVLAHVLNPNAEDCHDASLWVQDANDIVAYVNTHDDAVTKKYSLAIADDTKWSNITNFLQIVQGSEQDESEVLLAVKKLKPDFDNLQKSEEPTAPPPSLWNLAWSLPMIAYRMWSGPAVPEVFTKNGKTLICPPSLLYDPMGAFLTALENKLKDLSWESVSKGAGSCPFLDREDAEALVKANIRIAPAYLDNMRSHLRGKFKEILSKANPLQLAILQGNPEKIKALDDCDHYRVRGFGRTMLGLAVLTGNLEVVEALSSYPDLKSDGSSPIELAEKTGHLQILEHLLGKVEKKPKFSDAGYLLSTLSLWKWKIGISAERWYTLRASKPPRGARFQRFFKNTILPETINEVNERLNIIFLSHAWNQVGKTKIKYTWYWTSSEMKIEGSHNEINCEIMSRIWEEFCQNHPRHIPSGFSAWLGDALKDASEWSMIGAEGLFKRYQRGDLTILPATVKYKDDKSHVVGILLWKDYFCLFNGGASQDSTAKAIFHGKFQPHLMKEEIIKEILKAKTEVAHKKFFHTELPNLLGLTKDKDKLFLKRLWESYSALEQEGGHCSWFNFTHLVPVALSLAYDKRDRMIYHPQYGESDEIKKILVRGWDVSQEWYAYTQAWTLRNYLFSETRKEYELSHDMVKVALKQSSPLWLQHYSQATKNIFYQCEKQYLDSLPEEARTIYKIDKVLQIVKAWEAKTLYPSSNDLKQNRLR